MGAVVACLLGIVCAWTRALGPRWAWPFRCPPGWRGCVEAIEKGQWEASASLGMGRIEQLRYVILPQALRIAVPPTVGFSVQVVKGTALTSIIGFVELTRAGTIVTNATFQPFLVYGLVALIYFGLCWPLSKASQLLERKLNVAHNHH